MTLLLTRFMFKPPRNRARGCNQDRIAFYGHDQRGAEMVGEIADRHRMSRRDKEFLVRLVAEHLHLLNLSSPGVKKTMHMRWFRKLKLSPGPRMGVILGAIGDAQDSGKVNDRNTALEMTGQMIVSQPSLFSQ